LRDAVGRELADHGHADDDDLGLFVLKYEVNHQRRNLRPGGAVGRENVSPATGEKLSVRSESNDAAETVGLKMASSYQRGRSFGCGREWNIVCGSNQIVTEGVPRK
jgi:hypothetical protein